MAGVKNGDCWGRNPWEGNRKGYVYRVNIIEILYMYV
jgi:hypothetical protein